MGWKTSTRRSEGLQKSSAMGEVTNSSHEIWTRIDNFAPKPVKDMEIPLKYQNKSQLFNTSGGSRGLQGGAPFQSNVLSCNFRERFCQKIGCGWRLPFGNPGFATGYLCENDFNK